ncbi:MAG: CRISPR-associated helicase Cas3' [Crenarchaeota archaeon]|nr:CRISPR-associated helicase Cas3' [Thermoproteota archaeon]
MSILDKIRERGLDLSKETHPGKSYEEHVKECREIAKEIMRVYNYPKDLVELALLLCDVHDIGKLLHTWHISQKRRPLHSIEGAEWFMYMKENIGLSIDQAYQELIAYMIASHHSPLYVPAKFMDIVSRAEKISTKRYFIEYRKCKGLANKINGLLISLDKEVRHNLADVLGIVKMADLVSAKGLSKNEILTNYMWLEGLEERTSKGIFERARDKRGAFDQTKFERQKTIASSEGEHLLVAAPTGWGKTALALLRIALKKPVKVFYILPTITAIKDFYENFTKILDKRYVGEYFYFADVELLKKNYVEEEHPLDIYRYFIPKITITTIDQLLLTMLQAGKYYIRRFNLRTSLIIVDEFHLLTPEMIACMRVFLEDLLKSYNFSCLFMSATPSPIYEELLKEVLPQMKAVVLSDEYSRLKRHKIDYTCDQFVEELISEKEDLLEKWRTLIILNTVNEAQRIYTILKEKLGGKKRVTLIHGDFAYKDRMRKEEQINSADILISTQVAEVSLDISFDNLITELAPIPSLVQRFGRVNRYGKAAVETNVYICKPRSDKPYGPIMLQEAHKALPSLIGEIERSGETAYLNREFWQYEQIYKERIMEIEDKISKKLNDFMLNFFSLLSREEEILEFLGREETLLAIPEIYLNEALALLQKLKSVNKYEERMNIYAQIKENLVPASRADIKGADWNEELRLWVIKNYDRDLGIIRVKNYS